MKRVIFWPCVSAPLQTTNLFFPSYAMLYYTFSILKLYLYLKKYKKLAWWKSVCFFNNFIINMRIVNTLCISKERALCHYVNINVKVFVETFKITLDGGILNAN